MPEKRLFNRLKTKSGVRFMREQSAGLEIQQLETLVEARPGSVPQTKQVTAMERH